MQCGDWTRWQKPAKWNVSTNEKGDPSESPPSSKLLLMQLGTYCIGLSVTAAGAAGLKRITPLWSAKK